MSKNIYSNTNVSDQQDLASICEQYPHINVLNVNYDFEARGIGGLYIKIKTISQYDKEEDQFIDVRICDVPALIALIDRAVRKHDKECQEAILKWESDMDAGIIP
jgi:hypothetical protein